MQIVEFSTISIIRGAPPRDGLLGTMRQKAFNRNDLEREKKHSSSGYSSSSIITCCYALALHLYLSTHLLLWIKLLQQHLTTCFLLVYTLAHCICKSPSNKIIKTHQVTILDNHKNKNNSKKKEQEENTNIKRPTTRRKRRTRRKGTRRTR